MRIRWYPISNSHDENENNKLGVIFYAPEPLYKSVAESRKGNEFLRCPSVVDALRNTYVIRSPYDLTIHVNERGIRIDEFDQDFFDKHFVVHNLKSEYPVIGMPPRYVFLPEENRSVHMRLLPLMFNKPHDMGVIPGVFDISRWIRPIEFACEIYNTKEPLIIKRGDPLFCVQFIAEEQVELEQGLISDTLYKAISGCLHVKNVSPNMKLKQLYELANNYVKLIKKTIFSKEK